MKPFEHPIRPSDIAEIIDLSVTGERDTRSMARLQLEGAAALYNILRERPFAYLADEVGMGKTYQALALAALLWNEKPEARILFLSPRQNLQHKWVDDYRRFFRTNYRRPQGLGDDRVTSILFSEPLHRPRLFHNLRSWVSTLDMPGQTSHFLRHTSFTRPIYMTSRDFVDLDKLWRRVERELRSWGLFEGERPQNLSPQNASFELNMVFARALNSKLAARSTGTPYFDLIIVDEAQCLRNPHNQTNSVLFEALRGQVQKWLFLSATPAHSGPKNIPAIINHYPGAGEALPAELTQDLPAMQRALQTFMVRRQRKYQTNSEPEFVSKDDYRCHDLKAWALQDSQMSALEILAMGLVQKRLVKVLEDRNNRYRIGFLSSFESLQSSLRRRQVNPDDGDNNDAGEGDWHREQSDNLSDQEAPDTEFIQTLTQDFEAHFGSSLPHPKIDGVVNKIAPQAFGSPHQRGGHKFLIFTRRISTVFTLRDRLTARYLTIVQDRIRRCWDENFDWNFHLHKVHEEADYPDNDPESLDEDPGPNPLQEAMSRKGWLFRYRQTFRTSGRNALFFEDAWLERLCRAGGVDPIAAAAALPDELWAESWTHASRSAGKGRRQHRADRLRYIAVQSIRRAPHIFGLDEASAAPWRRAYEIILHDHLKRAQPGDDPHRTPDLFEARTLWSAWDERFPTGPLALPAAQITDERIKVDEICKRQVVRTIFSQNFRLTDTLLDLYFADEEAQNARERFPTIFLDWLASDDPGARLLRRDCEQWLAHLRLIVDSSLDGAGRPWSELARQETWPQLYKLTPVVGVVGGSGAHKSATRQFRTPSLPRIIVCTDTLKEGVDLHLFCDRVIHYGVAWTSGDLEQRVGRVDRFFSQIERRLGREGGPPKVQLHVGYPHVVSSLERAQVERVIERQRQVERLMDSPLAGASNEERELIIGARSMPSKPPQFVRFEPHIFPAQGRSLVNLATKEAQKVRDHYERWHGALIQALQDDGWRISPMELTRVTTIFREGRQHELSWSFDAGLKRYLLTVSAPDRESSNNRHSGPDPEPIPHQPTRQRLVGRTRRVESFIQLLAPTPAEGFDKKPIKALLQTLQGAPPQPAQDAQVFWANALSAINATPVNWSVDSTAQIVVPRGTRAHKITLRTYKNSVHITGVVAAIDDLGHRRAWHGQPTPERLHDWALNTTDQLPLGFLYVQQPPTNLNFGVHLILGALAPQTRCRLIEEVAWRADAWEARLTGADRW